jgi:rhodanese-related sulfurtransferase
MFIKILSWQLIKLLIRWQFPEIKQISTGDLAAWLLDDNRAKPLLLDARTLEEYAVSHLKNAQLIPNNLDDLVAAINFSTPIVVYCSVGYRSAAIARRLQSQGYQNVFNLSGSIFQWVNENRLVYQAEKPVTKVHPYQKFWQHLLANPHG